MAKDTSTENEAPEGYLVASDQLRIVVDYSVGHCANGKSSCHRRNASNVTTAGQKVYIQGISVKGGHNETLQTQAVDG